MGHVVCHYHSSHQRDVEGTLGLIHRDQHPTKVLEVVGRKHWKIHH